MRTLITGANGHISSALLKALTGDPSLRLRALVRDAKKAPALAGVEVVVADLDDPRSLTDAFADVDTLWLLTAWGPQAPHASMNAIWAARHAGVKHIVRLSAIGAAFDAPTRNGRLHALSDAELTASGIDWTIIKPHFFMQNLLGAMRGHTLYGPWGEGRLGMIDVRDIAGFAARVISEPQVHKGVTYTITGPASISMRDVAETVERVTGAPTTYQSLSSNDAEGGMIAAGIPRWEAEVIAEYGTAFAAGWGDFVTPDFADVTGRQSRGVADFARDHSGALGGS